MKKTNRGLNIRAIAIISALATIATLTAAAITVGAVSEPAESIAAKTTAYQAQTTAKKSKSTTKKAEATTKAASTNVGLESAKAAALKHAGVNAADAVFEKAYLDTDDLIKVYDIEFTANGYEYDYEIIAANGKVKEFDKERAEVRRTARKETTKTEATTKAASTNVGLESAKAAALKHAGVNAADAVFEKAYLDTDDFIKVYDIEFTANGYEYDYEIIAANGKIIESEKDFID